MSDKLDRKYPSLFIHVANKYPARWGYDDERDILCQGHSGIFRTPKQMEQDIWSYLRMSRGIAN